MPMPREHHDLLMTVGRRNAVIDHSARTDVKRIIPIAGLLTIAFVSGCATTPRSAFVCDAEQRCDQCRDNVHIIFVHSPVDIADTARLETVALFFRNSGFMNTTNFTVYQSRDCNGLANRIRRIHECHCNSRILVVAYSSGALLARQAARQLEEENYCIDSLVYLDADILNYVHSEEPCNIRRHVLIYRDGVKVPELCRNEDVCRVEEWNHFRVPTHHCAVDRMLSEAIALADEASQCQPAAPTRVVPPEPQAPYEPLPELPPPKSKVTFIPPPKSMPAWFSPKGLEFGRPQIALPAPLERL